MSDRGFWDDNLQALQQNYWESWSRISRKALGTETPLQKNPWEMAQEHWWQAVSPAAPEIAKAFMGRMMDQGKQFFRMAELFAGSQQPGDAAPDSTEVLDRISASLGAAGGEGAASESSERLYKMMGFWVLPLDTWQRMASLLSILPGDLFRNVLQNGAESATERLFSVPGLGYSQQEQAHLQELMRLIRGYQRALHEYSQFFSGIGSESVERLRETFRRKAVNGEVTDSARTLYDTWVRTCEAVYGEHVMTPDFAGVNGQLVNAAMAVKHHVGMMVDEKLGSLNLPTRRELRTLQSRIQENRRENKRLRSELEVLKEQVANLTSVKSVRRAVPAGTRRKTVPKQKSGVES